MGQGRMWHVQSRGIWASEVGSLKLLVVQCDNWARFLISRPAAGTDAGSDVLLRSGTRDDVGAAMAAVEAEARRLQPAVITLHRAA